MNKYKMGMEEMRACRREWISNILQKGWITLSLVKAQVRIEERFHFGRELKAYKNFLIEN